VVIVDIRIRRWLNLTPPKNIIIIPLKKSIAAVEKFAGNIKEQIIIRGAKILMETNLKSVSELLYLINCLAKKTMIDNLAISKVWMVVPPIFIHRLASLIEAPKNKVINKTKMESQNPS
jgi:hypothetical protein